MNKKEQSSGLLILIVSILIIALIAFLLWSSNSNNNVENIQNGTEVENIVISKTDVNLTVGGTYNIVAIVSPSTAVDKTLTYISSDSSVVSVDSTGLVKANSIGDATITIMSNNGKQATLNVSVSQKNIPITSITLSKDDIILTEGESTTLTVKTSPKNATEHTFTWTSSNPDVVSVSNGKVTAKKKGTTLIMVKTASGKIAICDVEVRAKAIEVSSVSLNTTSKTIKAGETFNLIATITPVDATNKAITWTSSNTSVATVSNGTVNGVKIGTTTITAKTSNGKTATCTVKIITATSSPVLPTSIKLSSTSGTIKSTRSRTIVAIVEPGNADQTVTWTSSDKSIATVSSKGKITGKKAGTTTITAQTANGKTATYKVTVKAIDIVMIGNSKTHTSNGSVWYAFNEIMKNRGYSANVVRSTAGGSTLNEHATGKCDSSTCSETKATKIANAHKVIKNTAFDIAILQEQTDTIYDDGKYALYDSGVKGVKNILLKNNSNTKIYLRQTWYYKDKVLTGQPKANSNATKLANKYELTVINDGTTFLNYVKKYNDTKIFKDERHGSYEGVYMAAACIYKKITGQDPTKITYYGEGGTTKARAKIMQEIANNSC